MSTWRSPLPRRSLTYIWIAVRADHEARQMKVVIRTSWT
jgi:hypothetical protein